MKRVTGIGGIFFKAKDAPALQAWYKQHLGIDVQEWGGTAFTWISTPSSKLCAKNAATYLSREGRRLAPRRRSRQKGSARARRGTACNIDC